MRLLFSGVLRHLLYARSLNGQLMLMPLDPPLPFPPPVAVVTPGALQALLKVQQELQQGLGAAGQHS